MKLKAINRWINVFKQRFEQKKVSKAEALHSWKLDSPSANGDCLTTEEGDRIVQGWVLFNADFIHLNSTCRIILQWNSDYELMYKLDVEREDVIAKILKEPTNKHPQLLSGFRVLLPSDATIFNLSLTYGQHKYHLATVHTKPSSQKAKKPKVLIGNDGWLFLDNDTNHSIDQFTGNIKISDKGINEWRTYANDICNYNSLLKSEPVILIAPTKESVMHQFHPRVQGAVSCLFPVFEAIGSLNVVYPVEELALQGETSFYKTDTHWTHKGASLAALQSIKAFNLPDEDFNQMIAADIYKSVNHVGDLGNKFDPNLSAPADVLISFHYRHLIRYDNGLPNFGRILATENSEAVSNCVCLVFGSSSFYSMLSYMCRYFKTVVFVHTAGNVDGDLVNRLKPDYLLVQTNARFMIRPPKNNYNLLSVISKKQSQLNDDQINQQINLQSIDDVSYLEDLGLSVWHSPVQEFFDSRLSH